MSGGASDGLGMQMRVLGRWQGSLGAFWGAGEGPEEVAGVPRGVPRVEVRVLGR